MIFDYLFDRWGVYRPSPDPHPFYLQDWQSQWCKSTVFPDNIDVVMDANRAFYHDIQGVYIQVMKGTSRLFEGWVLNQHEQYQTLNMSNELMMILGRNDVCWSTDDSELYLWETWYE